MYVLCLLFVLFFCLLLVLLLLLCYSFLSVFGFYYFSVQHFVNPENVVKCAI